MQGEAASLDYPLSSCALTNTNNLFKVTTSAARGNNGYSLLTFTQLLILQLFESFQFLKADEEAPSKRSRCMDPERIVGAHFPRKCRHCDCDVGVNPRRCCKICKDKIGVFYSKCDVTLCVDIRHDSQSFREEFHAAPVSFAKLCSGCFKCPLVAYSLKINEKICSK